MRFFFDFVVLACDSHFAGGSLPVKLCQFSVLAVLEIEKSGGDRDEGRRVWALDVLILIGSVAWFIGQRGWVCR